MIRVMLEGIGTHEFATREGTDAEVRTLKPVLAVVAGGIYSGAERVLLRDLVSAQLRGCRVRIASSDGPLVTQARAHGIEHISIPDLRLPDRRLVIALPLLTWRVIHAGIVLRSKLRLREICIINGVNALTVVRLLRRRTPVLYFAHDVVVRSDRRMLLRSAANRIDIAVAVSDAVAAGLRTLNVRTETVYNGTQLSLARVDPDCDSPPIIGIAGLLTPWKGQHVLLDAFALLKNTGAQLEIMGGTLAKDSEYGTRLRVQVDRLGLRARVRFLGHRDDPVDVMRRWTIAVSASTDPEGGPLVAIEAMSIGLPVVSSNHGGITEILGGAGELVAPGVAAELAEAIDAILDSPAKWAEHSRRGPEILKDLNLSVEAQSAHFLDVIDSAFRSDQVATRT